MPQVPKYESQVRENLVRNTPLQRYDVPNLGQQFSNVISQVQDTAHQANKYFVEEKSKADRVKLLGVQEELDDFTSKYFHGDGDQNIGALKKKGEDAFGLPEDFNTQYKTKIQEIEKNLDEDQKLLFAEYSAKKYSQSNDVLRNHISSETFTFNNSKLKARVNGLQNRASIDAYDVNKIKENLTEQNKAIFQLADANGLSEEETNVMINESNSKTHRIIMNTYMNKGEDLVASAYFNKVKDQLTSDDKLIIEKSLEETSTLGKSQRLADSILSKNLSMSESLELAKNIQEPKLRDMVKSRVKSDLFEKKQMLHEAQEGIYTDLFFEMAEGQKSFSELDKEKLVQLTPERYQALARVGVKGMRQESDLVAYQDYMTKIYDAKYKDEILQLSASEITKNLNQADSKKIIDLQAKLRRGEIDQFEARGILSDKQLVQESMKELKIKDKKVQAQFVTYMDKQKESWEKDNGRKMPRDEFKKMVDQNLIKGEVEGSGLFWDNDKFLFQLKPEEVNDFSPEDDTDVERLNQYREMVKTKDAIRKRLDQKKIVYDENYVNRVAIAVISGKKK